MFRTGFGKFGKVMAIDNATFQDLESFRKGWFFKMSMQEFWIFVWEESVIFKNEYKLMLC